MYEVIYLTGAPASGKSTLGKRLKGAIKELKVFHYSALLQEHLSKRNLGAFSEDDLRSQSAKVITPEDVEEVDEWLIREVQEARGSTHVLIDSHAVTKEDYGFRVTAFSLEKLRRLNPTKICMLYAESHEIVRRVAADSGGRPAVSAFQADMHIYMQSQVALAYSLEIGRAMYVLDATNSIDDAYDKLTNMLER